MFKTPSFQTLITGGCAGGDCWASLSQYGNVTVLYLLYKSGNLGNFPVWGQLAKFQILSLCF